MPSNYGITANKLKRTAKAQHKKHLQALTLAGKVGVKGVPPTPHAKQVQAQLKKACTTNPKPVPTTNKYTPTIPTKRKPNGTGIALLLLGYNTSTRNGLGNIVNTPCTAKAVLTRIAPNGVWHCVIPAKNNTPAMLVQVYTQGAFTQGYTLLKILYWA